MENFFEIAANQGFSVLLLGLAVYYFYQRQKSWENKIEELHEKRDAEKTQIIKLTEELKIIIAQNTQTLEAVSKWLSPLQLHDDSDKATK